MAKQLTVDEGLEAILDDDFSLSNGEPSYEEISIREHRTDVEELGEAVVDDPLSDHNGAQIQET